MKSKKTFLALTLFINLLSFGQTNTFPTTGNVGIGITNPTSKLDVNGGIKLNGNLYFANYGGGFFMQDNDWIRTFGNKNFYHNTGIMRTDGEFHVGPDGNRLVVNANGNVGIGTSNPQERLQVEGNIRIGDFDGLKEPSLTFGNHRHGIRRNGNFIDLFTAGGNGGFTITHRDWDGQDYARERVEVKVLSNGNVGIGTTNPDEKLTVNGTVHATEVKVTQTVPADYVFQKYYTGTSALKSDYVMPTLAEIENFTKKNHHLPNVPSAAAIQQNGLSLGEMSNVLLQKIEELTLYAIEQNKVIEELKVQVATLMDKKQ